MVHVELDGPNPTIITTDGRTDSGGTRKIFLAAILAVLCVCVCVCELEKYF